MISVVLVDDEMLVKVGLKSLIDWEQQGYRIVAEGENGEQGVELCKKFHPDLIITDIMMRPMDGIEMMKEIKKFDSAVKFIVLSGYDDFNLVKEALKLGALDYQLKLNTSAESVLNLLESIRPEFGGDRREDAAEGEKVDARSLQVLQTDFLKNLIGNVLPDRESIDSRKKALRLSLDERRLYLTVIQTDLHRIVDRYASKDYKLFEFMVLEILREIGAEFYSGYFFSWSLGVFVAIFSPPAGEKEEETVGKLSDMAFVFRDMLREYFGFEFQVSTNGPCRGLESLHREFERTWVSATAAPAQEDGAASPGPDESELRESLTHAFDILDVEAVNKAFEEIFRHFGDGTFSQAGALNAYCTQIVGFCDISLGSGFRGFCAERGTDISELATLDGAEGLTAWMKTYQGQVLEYLSDLAAHKNVLIENAKKYVQQNFSQRISLNDVADSLKISSGYLSSLFTKYEGVHFIDYVNSVKIKEAKKMLRTGNYKIYQVAYMLGYENSSYFSRIFKKVTGCAPKEILY